MARDDSPVPRSPSRTGQSRARLRFKAAVIHEHSGLDVRFFSTAVLCYAVYMSINTALDFDVC